MFHGSHYIGEDTVAKFEEDETWRKVFGPVFIYLNSTPKVSDAYSLWTNAKRQVHSVSFSYSLTDTKRKHLQECKGSFCFGTS